MRFLFSGISPPSSAFSFSFLMYRISARTCPSSCPCLHFSFLSLLCSRSSLCLRGRCCYVYESSCCVSSRCCSNPIVSLPLQVLAISYIHIHTT
ncbi:hypothetical protein BDV98DRAFT_212041 [Pterulicium gracile]|uniref:Uncharacterized protein n=1 Tax=Pterulicium gracile TaxID=1884261 RepID=A0A5C3Q8L9_9AGAR|nr:hypothetical protein BDV98DRAFT_212041 [Pterula gracilis]